MMTAKGMANAIRNSNIQNCDNASDALNEFWNAVKDYVEDNLEATYSWIGINPETEVPDPVTFVKCKAETQGSLYPCKLDKAEAALSVMSAQMNASAATWRLVPDNTKSPGFSLSPATILPTIVLSISNITDPNSAIEFICNQIINGIKKAVPAMTGNHTAFTGTATFINII